ncbi:hypothetical protein C5689_01575 [Methylosinus sporium]|uniref:Uncharacterized protein n=1 Tax=Methylosinus sporium TaxID=428 RepID=A0A2U1SW37_METSR|nr:hypothetical protein C5689_01575 [Methylosinus sporium]
MILLEKTRLSGDFCRVLSRGEPASSSWRGPKGRFASRRAPLRVLEHPSRAAGAIGPEAYPDYGLALFTESEA